MEPLKNLLDKNDEFREKLIEIVKREKLSIISFSKQIGIGHITLRKIIVEGLPITRIPTLMQIESYLKSKNLI